MVNVKKLRMELADALNVHIELLKDVEYIDIDHMDAFTFMMRRLGFMLERAPSALIDEKDEELYFMMFQYYGLLAELKRAIKMSFPYAKLHGITLGELLEKFPTNYETNLNDWWENRTGLKIEETKQTIIM